MIAYVRTLLPAVALMAMAMPGIAQTIVSPVTELSLERRLVLAQTLSTSELGLPADRLQAVASGALEVRERLIYNPSGASITSTLFLVPSGSAMPTPINTNLTGSILGVYSLNVERIYMSKTPKNNVMFTGTVAGASSGGVLGNVAGSGFAVSLAYTDSTPATVSDVVVLISGRVVGYTKDAVGTFVVPKAPPVVPPGTGPQVVIVAPVNTTDSQIVLDASKTTDASGTPLTFAWKSTGKTSAVLNPNSAVATVQFGEGMGDYAFELTVTNGNGVTVKQLVTITYYGR
jgi:hypothetical protein